MLVDNHCHLDYPDYDGQRDEIIARARAAGVGAMLTIGTEMATFEHVHAVAMAHPDIWCSVGVHPHEASSEGASDRAGEQAALVQAHLLAQFARSQPVPGAEQPVEGGQTFKAADIGDLGYRQGRILHQQCPGILKAQRRKRAGKSLLRALKHQMQLAQRNAQLGGNRSRRYLPAAPVALQDLKRYGNKAPAPHGRAANAAGSQKARLCAGRPHEW